ncbi:hypothetical protein BJF85_15365 [Saccharomonospora sp. CUA-673]|nr:hypothetical protein BJF85_15365 [Saccharomonospora sp. CUA-673]
MVGVLGAARSCVTCTVVVPRAAASRSASAMTSWAATSRPAAGSSNNSSGESCTKPCATRVR